MNKELSSILPVTITVELSSPGRDASECELLAPLTKMVESNGSGFTLKDALMISPQRDTREKTYHMSLDKRPYEVKTKHLPMSKKECKLAVVTDQSVYENLVRETTMEKYQRMLLSSISHEIRNPLNAVEGYLTMLKELAKEDEQDYIGKIRGAAQQVDLIVSGACDLLLNESKTTVLQPQHFDLAEITRSVLDIVSPNASKKALQLSLYPDSTVPRTICSDSKRYKVILFRLLANAVKFTEKGRIEVRSSYNERTKVLTTTVCDTGMGIADDAKEHLFQLYGNLDHANIYNPQGMGLGLALCKKIARILGGDISCSSVLGMGTSFTFTINNHDETPSTAGTAGTFSGLAFAELSFTAPTGEEVHQRVKLFYPPAASTFRRTANTVMQPNFDCSCAQVLIVDDEATNRTVLAHYLKSISVSSVGAENGAEGIRYVEQRMELNECCQRYKLILMDINMPIMDGTKATEELMRMFEKHPEARAPIVAVTAANIQRREDLQNLLSVGFNDVCMGCGVT